MSKLITQSMNEYTLLNLPLYDWFLIFIISIVAYIALLTIWKISINKATTLSQHTANKIDDILVEILQSTQKLTILLFALLIGLQYLDLPIKWQGRLHHLLFIAVGFQLAVWLNKSITLWTQRQLTKTEGELPNAVITTMLSWIFKVAIWCLVLLTILANVGVNITAFVASLGVGGVAVALAVQNILSDLFASLAIGLDKPFVIGDAVAFNDVSGTIERIELKTTHIRSLNGEQIICSNTDMLKNVIHNYKRMPERRVAFNFNVNYSTDVEAVSKIPEIEKNTIKASDKTRFDRAHFKELGLSALNFEVVYFIVNSDFNLYMDIQQAINLSLMREFKAMNIEFAFPTMTLNLPQNEAKPNSNQPLKTQINPTN